MKKLLLIILISYSGICLTAQPNLDSLWGVWNDQARADTNRLKALDDIIWFGYSFSDPDSAFYYAQIQYDFAEAIGSKEFMSIALNNQGGSYLFRGDFRNALDYYQQSLAICEELQDLDKVCKMLTNIGTTYAQKGDYVMGLGYLQRSLDYLEESGKMEEIPSVLSNIGSIYSEQGDYTNALAYFQRALKIFEDLGEEENYSIILNNLGTLYGGQREYEIALDYLQRSVVLDEKYGNLRGLAGSFDNIGTIYNEKGDFEQAMNYMDKSLKISEEIGDEEGVAYVLSRYGNIYEKMGDFSNSLDYLQRSLLVYEKIGGHSGIASTLEYMGEVYNQMGYHGKAINYCKKGLKMAEETDNILIQKSSCRCLYEAYKALGDGNTALLYHEQMILLVDSLKIVETNKILQQMDFAKQMLADSLQQEETKLKVEMAHQQEVAQKDKTQNLFMGGGILALLLALGFYSRWRFVKRSRDTISKERDRSENLLLNILPAEIAEELKEKGEAAARDFDQVSILFTDFQAFTQLSEKLGAKALVSEMNYCFKAFDEICERYNIEKIKTIGDSYMAAGGLPVPSEDSTLNTVLAGIEMAQFIVERKAERETAGKIGFEMRTGIHTGNVVAGIIGVKKFQYDIWGDTVNTASRMESNSEVGKVNISQTTYDLLKDDPDFTFESRGKIEVKGKGEIEMYFVSKA